MRFAVVVDGTIENVILLDEPDDFPLEEGAELASLEEHPDAGIGWERDGAGWVDNRPSDEPDPIEPDAALAAARAAGIAKLVALGLTEEEARAITGA